ncbi:pyridoxal 5'-phosphate synthase glutaminase subunit PdxT [Prescottella defluvii]|nr:pyridoxal 5'-phosphate synthase glutaminase subunit PdxT [Prescottella defluvii]
MANQPTIGVLALQGDVREHLAALDSCGARAIGVRRLSELESVDGLVIPGGESTTMSRLLTVFELLEPLRARLKAGMPAYGSCAGMILLASEILDTRPDAEHLNGLDMTVRRNAFGRQVDSFEADLDFAGIAGTRCARCSSARRGSSVSDRASTCSHECRRGPPPTTSWPCGRARSWPRSFHPEVTGDRRVHGLFVDMVRGTDPAPVTVRRSPGVHGVEDLRA